jgi:flavin-dependent dehydrogenase
MERLGKQAIVIGASIGGLLAARVLADFYDAVAVFERDALPDTHEPRKGVPQGRHAHGLLARGREVLDELFPGFSEDAVSQGAIYGDVVDDVLWFNYGVYLHNTPSSLKGLLISRPMLEELVRRSVLRLPNVRLQEQTEILEPICDRIAGRVTGVRAQSLAGATEAIDCDLLVDASGRGSKSPTWLEALGYAKPREDSIRVDIGYMTRFYRRRPEHLPGKQAVILGACRPDWRFGVILAQEQDRWIVTLGGYFGDYAPSDDAGYVEFARGLQKPEIFKVISITPLTSVRLSD